MKSPISIRPRQPSLGGEPDYGRALYPDPPSHDFLVWLIIAELMRRHHGAASPLRVKFGLIRGQLGVFDFGLFSLRSTQAYKCGVSRRYSDQMMAHVLRPAIDMIGAVEDPALDMGAPVVEEQIAGWVEYDYHIGHLVDAGREGADIPRWSPPPWAHEEVERFLGGVRPVVITLREADRQPERNSRIQEWLRFAAEIERDHPVLILRDTAKAAEPLNFRTWPLASLNAYIRAALYERALVNMMVQTGPFTWCQFGAAPYLAFKQLVPALPDWAHGQPCGWREQDHMEVGDQYPWASPLQRLAWADDTFENIRGAFAGFLRDAKRQEAA